MAGAINGWFTLWQRQIPAALWRLLARGGKLLYSTCSVFAQENQRVVDEFLSRHGDARLLPLADGVQNPLLPDDCHDGFFYALLHKSA